MEDSFKLNFWAHQYCAAQAVETLLLQNEVLPYFFAFFIGEIEFLALGKL
jgi:hypothetical protein